VARNQTGWDSDRYEMRIHVEVDGHITTTYVAHDPARWGNGVWRPLSQQAFSKNRREKPFKCHVVVTVATDVEFRQANPPIGPA